MRGSAMGVVLLLVAGLSVAVVPALRPTLIEGTAAAVPIPGIPAVGECLGEPVPYSLLYVGINSTGDTYSYPALAIGPCDGPRYGEVTAVIPYPAPVTETEFNGVRSRQDPNLDTCWKASYSYLGLPAMLDPTVSLWAPTISPQSSISQPLPQQRADGQRWLACLTYAESIDQAMTETTVAVYSGTLRNAVVTGNEGDRLGYCGEITSTTDGFQNDRCGQPHPYQQLAFGTTGTRTVSNEELTRTCSEELSKLISLTDLTAAGELRIVVTATDNFGAVIEPGDVPPNANLQCGIAAVGDRLLASSLVALGEKPIPWA